MSLNWKSVSAIVGAGAVALITAGDATGALQSLADANPIATKGYVDKQFAEVIDKIQGLIQEQKQAIQEQNNLIKQGFADSQWTTTVDRYNTLTALFKLDDTQLQLDMKDYDSLPTPQKRILDRRGQDIEKRRQGLLELRCKIDAHDAAATC